jgi:hypothetical protein
MIKVVFGWRDDPNRSPGECERHYRDVHMEYARQAYDGVEGFVSLSYNRVRREQLNDFNTRDPRDVEPDMDAFVELRFDDVESLERAFDNPLLDVMFEDHANFMQVDTPANIRIYHVDETLVLEREG